MNFKNQELINFLDSKFSPKVKSNTPATDCYEVDNLISENLAVKTRGFLAYSAIKPPVELEFEFLCNINMHYIKLNTTVGNQRDTGIEIFAKSDNTSPYVSLGRCIYDKPGLIFCNSRIYKPGHPLLEVEKMKDISYFKSNTFRIFLNAAFLKIVIIRTDKSVPCMGSVEVWGIPARSCSKITVETISKIVKKSKNHNPQDTNAKCSSQTSQENIFEIPSDFKDDLTFEIMTIPMTLPSGKTVDQSTLEKHIESEKSFGRRPCDPFTGKKFTETCKPILNTALKTRIDLFMIQNSHRKETYNLARIVGRSDQNNSVYFKDRVVSEVSGSKRKRELDEGRGDGSSSRNVNIKVACSKCNKTENIYVISVCNHLYCRGCVLECCVELECLVCKKKFERNDVRKHHC